MVLTLQSSAASYARAVDIFPSKYACLSRLQRPADTAPTAVEHAEEMKLWHSSSAWLILRWIVGRLRCVYSYVCDIVLTLAFLLYSSNTTTHSGGGGMRSDMYNWKFQNWHSLTRAGYNNQKPGDSSAKTDIKTGYIINNSKDDRLRLWSIQLGSSKNRHY